MEKQRQDIVVTIQDKRGATHKVRIAGARAKLSRGYIRARCNQLVNIEDKGRWFSEDYPFTDNCILKVVKECATYRMPDKEFYDNATRIVTKEITVEI